VSKKIIILGGGFGGLYVATELEKCIAAGQNFWVDVIFQP
jgi:NADH dehydrogenase FAD-containing subunit